MTIEQRIKEANGRLKAKNWGIRIEQRGSRLSLVGTLPPKPNSQKFKPHQQRISIAPANPEGVKLAESEARKLAIRLDAKTFDWDDYLPQENPNQKTWGDWIEEFKQDYFLRRKQNYKSQTTWEKDYYIVYRHLSRDNLPSLEELKKLISTTEPDTRTRKRFCFALSALAKFIGIDFDFSRYAGSYSPNSREPRNLPSDSFIVQVGLEIEDIKWKWIYFMLATYGLRNHEIFHLDLDRLRQGDKILSLRDGKTGSRKIWPLHPEWFEQFGLDRVKMPQLNLDRSNSELGHAITQRLRKTEKIPFPPYDLRHCWAVRSLAYGIDISLASQQMGHSLQVHSNLYHAWISEDYHQRAFEIAIAKSDRPLPPVL
jgi:integrase